MTALLIVCLGNPGKQYEKTRHNVGFMVADRCAELFDLSKNGSKFKSQYFSGNRNGVTIHLIKPDTFMNLSGQAVVKAAQFFKIPVENIVVVYDDFDIEFGIAKLRQKGSGGTHNGMKSIIQLLGSNLFPRLRVGIGPKPSMMDTASFVLSNFTQTEQKELPTIIDDCVEAIGHIVDVGVEKAMNKVNAG